MSNVQQPRKPLHALVCGEDCATPIATRVQFICFDALLVGKQAADAHLQKSQSCASRMHADAARPRFLAQLIVWSNAAIAWLVLL